MVIPSRLRHMRARRPALPARVERFGPLTERGALRSKVRHQATRRSQRAQAAAPGHQCNVPVDVTLVPIPRFSPEGESSSRSSELSSTLRSPALQSRRGRTDAQQRAGYLVAPHTPAVHPRQSSRARSSTRAAWRKLKLAGRLLPYRGSLLRRAMTAPGALSVSSILVRALLEITEAAGVPRERLLQGSSIEPRSLQDTAQRFELATFEQLQIRALDLTGDEALGLHMAERASEAAFDLIAHLVAHAPTLRAAVELCSQFERLLMDGAHLRLHEHGVSASIKLVFVRTSPRADRMLAEFALAALMRMLEAFGGRGTLPSAAHFEHPSPPHRREYTRVFSGAERFGRDFTGLDFDRQILDRPQLHQHPALSALLRDHAQQQLALVGQERGLIARLREYLLSRTPSRLPDMQTAARDLGVSDRSLRRRLSEEGTSYRALVQATVERSAKQLLGDPRRSVQETAHALGFADAAAFHRAFKRWTGLTPLEFREGVKAVSSDNG